MPKGKSRKRKLTEDEINFQDLVAMVSALGMLPGPLTMDPRLERPGGADPFRDQAGRRTLDLIGRPDLPEDSYEAVKEIERRQDPQHRAAVTQAIGRDIARSRGGYGPSAKPTPPGGWYPGDRYFRALENPLVWDWASQRERNRR